MKNSNQIDRISKLDPNKGHGGEGGNYIPAKNNGDLAPDNLKQYFHSEREKNSAKVPPGYDYWQACI